MSKNTLLFVLIFIGLCAAMFTFAKRYQAEAHNRRVELVVDWSDTQALANTTSLAVDDVLRKLRDSGITTIAVTEDTLETLRGSGIVNYQRTGKSTVITFAPGFPDQIQRVLSELRYRTRLHITQTDSNALRVDAPWQQFNSIPIGLDSEAVSAIRTNNLLVAPRLLNYTGVTGESITRELTEVKQLIGPNDIGPLIFSGAAVLGNRPLIHVTAENLRDLGLTYGSVEFAKTFGDDDLARMAAPNTVRVHSIGNDEMGTMDEPTAEERFVRAAKERNIRVCYVRLFINGLAKDPDVIHGNTEFIKKIVKGMGEARLTVQGPAHPYYDDPNPSRPMRIIMALGVMAGLMLLLRVFTGIDGRPFWMSLGVLLLVGAVLALPSTTAKGREILALLSACTFPTLGLCLVPIRAGEPGARPAKSAAAQAFLEYLRITLITLAGVLFIVGLLSGRLFLLKVDQFLGVKLVLVAPVLLVAIFYGLGLSELPREASWTVRRNRLMESIRSLASQPLLLGQVVIGIVAIVALALFVARSGNDPGVGVSPTELKTRALLDKYLGVRPRTKEFLLGHPALFFALAAAASTRYRKWILPLLVVGAIGQSSLLDTFCHLHTPLALSMLRALIGWLLGGVIGALVFAMINKMANKTTVPKAHSESVL